MANLSLRSMRSEHLRNRLGQCSEMSPEGAKGYVTATVRCPRVKRPESTV
jgi:hypothetical protein